MKVTVIGAGWVGVVMTAALARSGHQVVCTDIQEGRLLALQNGEVPFFEPGLAELLKEGVAAGRIRFVFATDETLRDADIVMSAVGTPPLPDGSADVTAVLTSARQFGRSIEAPALFITKSTVPPGTGKRCEEAIKEELQVRGKSIRFAVASNPEFLAEGTAVRDALEPERIVVGCDDERFFEAINSLYAPFVAAQVPLFLTSVASAEMIKYAANAFLATKLSFINEIANYSEMVGADPYDVAKGIGMDSRIGAKFLRPGVGYGGSCFPKDVRALIAAGQEAGYRFRILPEVDRVNVFQRARLYDKLTEALQGVRGKRVAIWGLSYKPETDDVRESPALYFIDRLDREGGEVIAYDPKAKESILRVFPNLQLASSAEDALKGADALVLLTEWEEFRRVSSLDIKRLMRGSAIIDGRGFWKEIPR